MKKVIIRGLSIPENLLEFMKHSITKIHIHFDVIYKINSNFQNPQNESIIANTWGDQ